MRGLWMDAINISHPDWVEIVTWNDFVEGTYVSPIDDPARYIHANDLGGSIAPPSTPHFFHSHRGATDLLGFFVAWYKTGRQPPIRRDSVYWAYRTQLSYSGKDGSPSNRSYGILSNAIRFTANLVAPAVLHVSIGSVSRSISLPAGSTDVQVPLVAGPMPHFELARNGLLLVHGRGDDPIVDRAAYQNFYYSTGSMHD